MPHDTTAVVAGKAGFGGMLVMSRPACAAGLLALFAMPIRAAALTITPVFSSQNGGFNPIAQSVINNAIGFYQTKFSDPIHVTITFINTGTDGLGASEKGLYLLSYPAVKAALIAGQSSLDDATAVATLPATLQAPFPNAQELLLAAPDARALGFIAPGKAFTDTFFPGQTTCDNLAGQDGCIGLALGEFTAPDGGAGGPFSDLLGTTEHEIDEVLGLGSGLFEGVTPDDRIMPEDLFRWAGNGVRGYGENARCPGSAAYFSIDGGATNLDDFNNCNNGADYGDWLGGPVAQVQDAFGTIGANESLNGHSPEVRALDIIGFSLVNSQTVTPEPSSVVLLATGLLGLAPTGRRTRRKKLEPIV